VRSSHRLALAGVAAAGPAGGGLLVVGFVRRLGRRHQLGREDLRLGRRRHERARRRGQVRGTLNVIALPPTWANYGTILSAFTANYGITINSALPDGSSQQEVNAVKSENGTAKAPDVLDVGMAVALANTSLFAPYEVSTWSSIPAAQKESAGLWVQDYGGYMAVGYSSSYGTITSLNDLLGPKFKGAVALTGATIKAGTTKVVFNCAR